MISEEHFIRIRTRYQELQARLSQGDLGAEDIAAFGQEIAELEPVIAQINEYDSAREELASLEEMRQDPNSDTEMRSLAEEEYFALKSRLPEIERRLQIALLPKDKMDARNAILEIRAGTGGDEAALFAADVLTMYQRFAQLQKWRFEVMALSETELGGIKEAIIEIQGNQVFAQLKFESGVHRVQRVPDTETGGRIHTSAATVAVLPEAEDVDIEIADKDLRIDTYRASGAGGQHVNKTDSAVRITHLPSGLVVQQQDEKSQHKNKARALKILKSRLLDHQQQKIIGARAAERKSQIGSGDRSERIRTYNFPQSRVTDHRINLTLYKLDKILQGEALPELIEALMIAEQSEKLASFVD